jgi:hypothetical protein
VTAPTVPAWDRTRWDRLQAALLVGAIALASSAPAWVWLATATGHIVIGVTQ